VQYLIVFDVASFKNLIVDDLAFLLMQVFIRVRSLVWFNPFRLPLIVTLSAPFKLISGPSILPVMLSPVNVG